MFSARDDVEPQILAFAGDKDFFVVGKASAKHVLVGRTTERVHGC